jgi:DnaJ-class molecular chaperone
VLTAMAAVLVGLLGYVALCAARPFAPCRKCAGTGETERFGKARTCPRCRGKKYRLRVGRRLHNAWRRTYEDGNR